MNRFAGATSISSAQYYGRDESDMAARRNANMSTQSALISIVSHYLDSVRPSDLIGSVDLEVAKERALEMGQKLTSLAKDWLEDWSSY